MRPKLHVLLSWRYIKWRVMRPIRLAIGRYAPRYCRHSWLYCFWSIRDDLGVGPVVDKGSDKVCSYCQRREPWP